MGSSLTKLKKPKEQSIIVRTTFSLSFTGGLLITTTIKVTFDKQRPTMKNSDIPPKIQLKTSKYKIYTVFH